MYLETLIVLSCLYFYKWYNLLLVLCDLLFSFGICLKALSMSVHINLPYIFNHS